MSGCLRLTFSQNPETARHQEYLSGSEENENTSRYQTWYDPALG